MLKLFYGVLLVASVKISSQDAMRIIEDIEENAEGDVNRRWVYECENGEVMIPCGMPGGTAWEIVEN